MEPKVKITKASIFLNGYYPENDLDFYIGRLGNVKDNRILIAVDGGLKIFEKAGADPDVIIGDFDSVDSSAIAKYQQAETIRIPSDGKDKTDFEFAIDYCFRYGIKNITVYGASDSGSETDHLLGNIFLMVIYRNSFESIRMLDFSQEIIPVIDETYHGTGLPGDMISVIPIGGKIKYRASGLKYRPKDRYYDFGRSAPLRNELSSDKFSITVEGRAVIVKHYRNMP